MNQESPGLLSFVMVFTVVLLVAWQVLTWCAAFAVALENRWHPKFAWKKVMGWQRDWFREVRKPVWWFISGFWKI